MKKSVEWQSYANKAIYASAFVILVFALAISLQGPIEEQPLGAPGRGATLPTTISRVATLPPTSTLPTVTGIPEVPYTPPTPTTFADFLEKLKEGLTLKSETDQGEEIPITEETYDIDPEIPDKIQQMVEDGKITEAEAELIRQYIKIKCGPRVEIACLGGGEIFVPGTDPDLEIESLSDKEILETLAEAKRFTLKGYFQPEGKALEAFSEEELAETRKIKERKKLEEEKYQADEEARRKEHKEKYPIRTWIYDLIGQYY